MLVVGIFHLPQAGNEHTMLEHNKIRAFILLSVVRIGSMYRRPTHFLSFFAEYECDKWTNQEVCYAVLVCVLWWISINLLPSFTKTHRAWAIVWMVGVAGSWWFWHLYVLVQFYSARNQKNDRNGCGIKESENESWIVIAQHYSVQKAPTIYRC